jgi:hypothetical protein
MLDDFPWDARHIQGFPHKYVFVCVEKFDEHAFLFGRERGADAYHLALGAVGVYEDLLGALCGLEGPGQLLGVGCFLGSLLRDDRKLLRGDGCRGELATLYLALISMLEGGSNGDDPTRAWHLKLEVCVCRTRFSKEYQALTTCVPRMSTQHI